MFVIAALLGLSVVLGPYDGPPLPGSIPDTVKFAVRVSGTPGATVHLHALAVPAGYVASFCTPRVCSRDRVDLVLAPSGRERIELQYIKNEPQARAPAIVSVVADGTRPVSFPFVRGKRGR